MQSYSNSGMDIVKMSISPWASMDTFAPSESHDMIEKNQIKERPCCSQEMS